MVVGGDIDYAAGDQGGVKRRRILGLRGESRFCTSQRLIQLPDDAMSVNFGRVWRLARTSTFRCSSRGRLCAASASANTRLFSGYAASCVGSCRCTAVSLRALPQQPEGRDQVSVRLRPARLGAGHTVCKPVSLFIFSRLHSPVQTGSQTSIAASCWKLKPRLVISVATPLLQKEPDGSISRTQLRVPPAEGTCIAA
jgi:hypothetical protein